MTVAVCGRCGPIWARLPVLVLVFTSHLETLFLVVIVGEFNAGKSSVLNAFFGAKLMEEGPIPTTAKVTIVRHGEEFMERQLSEFLVEKRIPSPYLLNLNLVDFPDQPVALEVDHGAVNNRVAKPIGR